MGMMQHRRNLGNAVDFFSTGISPKGTPQNERISLCFLIKEVYLSGTIKDCNGCTAFSENQMIGAKLS